MSHIPAHQGSFCILDQSDPPDLQDLEADYLELKADCSGPPDLRDLEVDHPVLKVDDSDPPDHLDLLAEHRGLKVDYSVLVQVHKSH